LYAVESFRATPWGTYASTPWRAQTLAGRENRPYLSEGRTKPPVGAPLSNQTPDKKGLRPLQNVFITVYIDVMDDIEIITVQAKTREECYKKVRDAYGERFMTLNKSTVRVGGFLGLGSHEEYQLKGYISLMPLSLRKPSAPVEKAAPSLEDEKQKVLAALGAKSTDADPKMQEILNTVKNIQEKLTENTKTTSLHEHENLQHILDLLEQNDFLPDYRKKILERAKNELSLGEIEDFYELQQRVLAWIGESIPVFKDEKHHKSPRIIILVGPTGVGKTTTIAKLAAGFLTGLLDGNHHKVSLITIDKYRIAAEQQLEGYAAALSNDIWEVPFSSAGDSDELKKCIALQSEDVDIIMIDTIGRSPRNAVEIAEMKQMLAVCGGRAEVHLALMAATKAADILEIARQFEPFAYQSVIITKLDETRCTGNVISALAEKGKPVSFVTDGQESIPQKLKKAGPLCFLLNLDGFEVDRARLRY
jgi:flagellar biosynthesis protein FlhF